MVGKAYLETKILSASPVELIHLLYEGATESVKEARRHLAAGDIASRSAAISKSMEILISYAAVPFYFGGTSLLIVVSVTMDTVAQVQGYLLAHQYEGLIKRSKLRGRQR